MNDAKKSGPTLRHPLAAGVPAGMAPPFVAAQALVETFFAQRREEPALGTIHVADERYLFVRAAALSTEFVDQVVRQYGDRGEAEAREVANALLFDLAHTIGKADARAFHARMGVDDPIQRLSAGPIHFAFTGWARVEIAPDSRPSPDDDFVLHYRHPNAFECDAWVAAQRQSEEPVCIMNAGYSSGWCEESFGLPLVAMEYACRTSGDDECWFVMAPPHRIQAHLDRITGAVGVRRPWSGRLVPEFFGRKRLEEELRRHRDHLEELVTERTRELEAANARLVREADERRIAEQALRQAQKMEAVGSLAGGIAHDFNNVLTSIQMGLEFALEDLDVSTEVGQAVRDALRSSKHAAALVKRLMSVSRPQQPNTSPVRPDRLIEQLATLLRRTQPKAIEIETHSEHDWRSRAPVLLDAHQIEQALLNLALNAADAMPDGGKLELRVRTEHLEPLPGRPHAKVGDFVVFEVEDEGTGIELDAQDRVFEPFFTTKTSGEGSGLGLAMVASVTTGHGGWIELDSELGRGTEFRLYLPFRAATATEVHVPAPGTRRAAEHTILLVDDEDAVRQQLTRVLQKNGFTVFTATDGVHALDVLAESEPLIDVILTDLNMPRLDGWALMEAVVEAGYQTPVILSSGYLDAQAGGGDLDTRARARGFAGILAKPYAPSDLLALIDRVLTGNELTTPKP